MAIPKSGSFGFADMPIYLTSKNKGYDATTVLGHEFRASRATSKNNDYNAMTSDAAPLHFCRGNTGKPDHLPGRAEGSPANEQVTHPPVFKRPVA